MSSVLSGILKVRNNPIEELGKFYFVYMIVEGILAVARLSLYLWLSLIFQSNEAVYALSRAADILKKTDYLSVLSYSISIIFLVILAMLYRKAWKYSYANKMLWMSTVCALTAVSSILGFPFVIKIYLLTDIIPSNATSNLENFYLVGNFVLLVILFVLFAMYSILIALLLEIYANFEITDAKYAIIFTIASIIMSITCGTVVICDAFTAALKGLLSFLEGSVHIASLFYLFKTFTITGKIYKQIEKRPEILDYLIEVIRNGKRPINLRELAIQNRVPFEWLLRRVKRSIEDGKLRGSIVGHFYLVS